MQVCILVGLLYLQLAESAPVIARLENGLQVVVIPDHDVSLISVQLWYRVGSADDDLKNPGLCHVTRALLERRAAGGGIESRTLRDACYFARVVPPGQLGSALVAEAERMRARPADPAEIGAVVRAAAGDSGFAPGAAEADILGALLADDPYQHSPGLVAASLKGVSPEEVNEFLERWFVPGNATLVVVGDVQPPLIQELAREHFAGLPWKEPPRREWQRPPGVGQLRPPPVSAASAGVDVAWLTPGLSNAENSAVDVLLQRLCNPVDGPLRRRLVDAGCLPPRWHREAWRRAGAAVLSVNVSPAESERAADIERIIREALERAAETPATEVELNRARALAAREVHNRRLTFAARALELGLCEVVGGDLLLARWVLPRIERCTVGDLQRAAAHLRAARTVWRQRTAGNNRTPDTQPSTAEPRPQPPCPSGETTAPINDVVKLTICVDPTAEVAEVRTLVGTGPELAPALRALLAVGSTDHSADQIRDYVSYHGLDLIPLDAGAACGLSSRGPADRVPQMIELQAELIRHPNRTDTAAQRAALAHLRKLRNVEITVRGAVDPAVVRDAVKLVWDDCQTAAHSP